MVFAEGVDFSSTANDDWAGLAAALKANGKHFAGRYAVGDKSPNGRGITAEEYRALTAAGIEVFLYWEATEAWMLGGWDAGVRAAQNAVANIAAAGMPAKTPVYYSHDVDPTPDQFATIDDCLRGAASVVGIAQVGFYGGWLGIDHVHAEGTATFFCQTIAWQYGRGVHPAANLHQYGFNQYFAGTNCDLVAAIQPHYGQASDFLAHPHPATTTTTTTLPPKPQPAKLPRGMSAGVVQRLFNPLKIRPTPSEAIARFNLEGGVSQAWLRHGLATIPEGGTWRDGRWPELTQVIVRGDGRREWVFSDGFTFEVGVKE